MTAIFGGGRNKEAEAAAALSQRQQQIANDRQLAALNKQDQEATPARRNPRGRRLFTDKSTLA